VRRAIDNIHCERLCTMKVRARFDSVVFVTSLPSILKRVSRALVLGCALA